MAYTSKRFQRVVRIKFFSSWLRETTSFRGGSWARRGWEIHMWLWYFTENDTCTKCSGSPEVSWYEIMHAWTYCSSVQYINFINIFINSDLSSSLKRVFFFFLLSISIHCIVMLLISGVLKRSRANQHISKPCSDKEKKSTLSIQKRNNF